MLKFGKISTKIRGILTVLVLAAITCTVTSCKGKTPNPIKLDEKYLSVNSYDATNGEVWEELQWDASALFDDKAKEAIVSKQLEGIKAVMKDSKHEKYSEYKNRLKCYLQEAVYGFDFSLEDHQDQIDDLEEKEKETKAKQYADKVYSLHKVNITQEEIVSKLMNNDFDALSELYQLYYLSYATELFALEKLNEEITKRNEECQKDDSEDTVGFFAKSTIVSQYKKEYLNQGDSTAIAIKFASLNEANETLRAFGIKVNKGKFCYIESPEGMNFQDYKTYYDKFDFNKPQGNYVDLEAKYGNSIILQLFISMYNYIYPYHDNLLENIQVDYVDVLDQRATTAALIELYPTVYNGPTTAEKDDKRIIEVMKHVTANETNKALVEFTAEEAKDVNDEFYNLIYNILNTPAEVKKDSYERYTTSARSIGNGYYMVFKVDQKSLPNDEIYKKDITEDDLYDAIKNNESLYNSIIDDLTDGKLTKEYISEKISEAMKDVKVKIFDKEIEISYAQSHADYTKTLSGAPDKNTIAEFKYNDTVIKYYLTTEDGTGLWDILEYRDGTNTAIDIIQTKMIKDSQAYQEVNQEDLKLYEESLEYILASFANGGLAQQGYPASLGKYNFLMLYYHSADIDQIISDIFRVNAASTKLLNDYSSKEVNDFFVSYSKRAYDNFFNISAKQVGVYLDTNEDGKPDDITKWENNEVTFDGKQQKMIDVAAQLYQDIYNKLLLSSEDHATALSNIVNEYNTSSRHNPTDKGQFDKGNYDPIPTEWDYAKYKKLGFNISLEDITVTNSDSDKDVKIKDKLHNVYKSEGFAYKNFFPSKYLENPQDKDALLTVNNKLNYFVITGAIKPSSAKYEQFKDQNNIYTNIYYMYNDKPYKVDNIYNDNDLVNSNQIQAFIFEYINSKTTNLVPTEITAALNAFVSPILSRYQSQSTQQRISINYIANGDINNLKFTNPNNLDHYVELQQIQVRISDGYVTYTDENESIKYNNFHDWFKNVDSIKGGKN